MQSKKLLLLTCLVLLVGLVTLAVACEPGGDFIIKNQSNQKVTVYSSHIREDGTTDGLTERGKILSGEMKTITLTFVGNNWINRITIKDESSNTVFVHDYKLTDFQKNEKGLLSTEITVIATP